MTLKTIRYPYPYKAWLTIANDPDNTLIKDWHELNSFIWKELQLPLANTLFVKSFNANLPEQVNLVDHPEIATQPHDTIHTWGDYMHARKEGFDRQDAEEAIEILKKYGIAPKVWIDHAQFAGNLLHSNNLGSVPETKDTSGHKYVNYQYTLDLIRKLGITYVWDGGLTDIVAQDRPLSPINYFREISTSGLKMILKCLMYYGIPLTAIRTRLKLIPPENRQYFVKEFPDKSRLYCFRRYGQWPLADIYGLGEVIGKKRIDSLIEMGGTMVAYTHLGKRPIDKMDETFHIPPQTRESLTYVKERYDSRELMLSSVSEMLDYLVLRDHIRFDQATQTLHFEADGIRYEDVTQSDLVGKVFSFSIEGQEDIQNLKVQSQWGSLQHSVEVQEEGKVASVKFV